MLSYSTGTSGAGAGVDAVREATRLVSERRPNLPVEGPIQYDAAVDAGVAARKLPASAVAGRATVLIFPDLHTGNIAYKAVQRSAGATALGPILQGLRKPVNDLSRGCTVSDVVGTVVDHGDPGPGGDGAQHRPPQAPARPGPGQLTWPAPIEDHRPVGSLRHPDVERAGGTT